MTKTLYTPEQKKAWKQEKMAEQKQLLEDAVANLVSSESWTNWVRYGRNNLRKYSLNNRMLIWWQKPEATLVRGRKQWLKEKATVQEDAKRINILAPVLINAKDESGSWVYGPDGKPVKKVAFYRAVQVYDVTDTDAPLIDNESAMVEIEGDDHADKLAGLEGFARELGFIVRYKDDTGSALGTCDFLNHEITVNSTLSKNAQVRVLVHELSHAYGDVNYQDYSRDEAEVIVESATVMALGILGFDVSQASVPYIAEWGDGDMKAAREFVSVVDKLVDTLTEKMGI